ncbi:MAG: thiaminase II [Lachnospiraceae bacterium]|nr:thiaminase II [Lachnospiraceae bacterium]
MENKNTAQSVTERLIADSADLFEEFYAHPFVTGMGDGTLDHAKFQYYMIQDYLYLIDYAKVFAVGAAKADDLDIMRVFASSLHATVDGEMELHRGYMRRLGISGEEAENTPMHPANRSYTSYMLRIAYEGGAAEVTAAILSCAVSYKMIGEKLLEKYPHAAEDSFFGEWIRSYTSREYREETQMLAEQMNRLAADLPESGIRKLSSIFRICSEYERGFWDMGWQGAPVSAVPFGETSL